MAIKNTKARNFGFLLYPDSIPNDWKEKLESLGVSMAVSPLHDMDEKKIKIHGIVVMLYEMESTIKTTLSRYIYCTKSCNNRKR